MARAEAQQTPSRLPQRRRNLQVTQVMLMNRGNKELAQAVAALQLACCTSARQALPLLALLDPSAAHETQRTPAFFAGPCGG